MINNCVILIRITVLKLEYKAYFPSRVFIHGTCTIYLKAFFSNMNLITYVFLKIISLGEMFMNFQWCLSVCSSLVIFLDFFNWAYCSIKPIETTTQAFSKSNGKITPNLWKTSAKDESFFSKSLLFLKKKTIQFLNDPWKIYQVFLIY